ncbi:PAS domain-containing sensor histidine kinase [Desulfarculus baarsii]
MSMATAEQLAVLAQAMEHSPTAWAVTDEEGRVRRHNAAFAALLGLESGQEAAGRPWSHLSPVARRAEESALLRQAGQDGRAVSTHKALVQRDGGLITVVDAAHPCQNGGFWHLLSPAVNRPGLVNGRCQAMLEAFDDPIYVCDQDHNIEFLNQAMIRRLGRDATGEKCHQAIHGLDDVCPWCEGQKVQNGQTVRQEMQRSSDSRWYNVVCTPVFLPDGRVARQTVFRDVTSQKLLEQHLRHALDSQRVLFESLPVGVLAVDEHYNVTQINPAAQKILGVNANQALGRYCHDVMGCDNDPLCPLRRSAAEGRTAGPDDWHVRDSRGALVDVRMWAAAIFDSDGRHLGGVEAFQDISEAKALERHRARIIAMLAHDMKTPLISIRGFANLLLRDEDQAHAKNRRKYAQFIEQEAARLDGFVHRFLEMSRLQDGALKLKPERLDLAERLAGIVEAVRPQFRAANVELLLEAPAPAPVEADAELLGRIFDNLLDNALQHSPTGGQVHVSVIAEGGEAQVRVRDQGSGIPADELSLIFEPFFRGSNSKTTQGYGLGLAAAKAIACLHGGRLVVDSQPGHGALFTLRLPISRPSQAAAD